MAISTRNFFLVFLVFLLSAHGGKGSGYPTEKMTHLHFFMHEYFPGAPNPTDALVLTLGRSDGFGNTRVFDNEMREGNETSSKLIGRFQGTTVVTSLQNGAAHSNINMVFTEGEYNGSSLALYGRVDPDFPVTDRAIIGGSGRFRMARGYALSKILFYNATYLIIEFDVYAN